ncbi:hypothetical protein V6Z11_A13G000200, partial [Gossypium hirsutum]
MMRAQEADPTNLEVLLALGVSHTNELEQTVALKYLYGWLCHHPKYGTLAPLELADSVYYADVSTLGYNSLFFWLVFVFWNNALILQSWFECKPLPLMLLWDSLLML